LLRARGYNPSENPLDWMGAITEFFERFTHGKNPVRCPSRDRFSRKEAVDRIRLPDKKLPAWTFSAPQASGDSSVSWGIRPDPPA
jgi:hypothetical protein